VREFCELRNLLPRGVKLAPEDVWERCSYVLSVKLLEDPQFSGQTKERLSSRECAAFVSGVAKDAFSLWLNQHTAMRSASPSCAISAPSAAAQRGRKVVRKKVTQGPALPGKLADCTGDRPGAQRAVPGGGRLRRRQRQAGPRPRVPGHHAAARQDPEHLGGGPGRGPRLQEVHDIAVALGVDPAATTCRGCATARSASSPTPTPTALHIATLLCALFVRTFRPLVAAGHVFVAMPPLYRIDVGKEVFYALDDAERRASSIASPPRRRRARSACSASRAWAR
jgi:topoisomerase-4 subunit B